MIYAGPERSITRIEPLRRYGWTLITDSVSRVVKSRQSIETAWLCLWETQQRIQQSIATIRQSDSLIGRPSHRSAENQIGTLPDGKPRCVAEAAPVYPQISARRTVIAGRDNAQPRTHKEDS
jgi:hypothetical protein